MNYKQKLGYMVLGAVIMLVGMGAAFVLSPPLSAHDTEYIVCKGLTVVDGKRNKAIRLMVGENRNYIIVYDKTGKKAVGLHTDGTGNGVVVFDKMGDIKWETP